MTRPIVQLCEHGEAKPHEFASGRMNSHGTEVAAFADCPGGREPTVEEVTQWLKDTWGYVVRLYREPQIDGGDEPGGSGLLYQAWGVIANAGNSGDWSEETVEWAEAATAWRDKYHAYLDSLTKATR